MAKGKGEVSLTYVLLCLIILAGIGYLLWSAFGNGGRDDAAETKQTGSVRVTITDGMTTELLRGAVPAQIPVSDLTVGFSTGEIKISGNAKVNGILTSAVVEGYPDLGAIKAILPDSVSFAASFQATAGDDGVEIKPTGFYLAGYRIPVAFLPASLKEALNDTINSAVGGTGLKITSITLCEGNAEITAEQKK